MQPLFRSGAVLVLVGLLTGHAYGQSQPKPDPAPKDPKATKTFANVYLELKKAKLDDLLAKALKDNPDLKVAESKVRDAEVELARVRMQVTQKVAKAYFEIQAAQALLAEAETRLARSEKLRGSGAISAEELSTYFLAVQNQKANLAKLEAELPYLVGRQPDNLRSVTAVAFIASATDNTVRVWDVETVANVRVWEIAAAPKGTLADKLRKSLDTPIKVEFESVTAREILDYIKAQMKGINILAPINIPGGKDMKLSEPVPIGAALQCFEDTFGVVILVRDYGLVVTSRERVPPGAMSLQQFWKNPPPKTSAP